MPVRSLRIPPGDHPVTVTAAGFTDFKATDINAKLGTVNTLDAELAGN